MPIRCSALCGAAKGGSPRTFRTPARSRMQGSAWRPRARRACGHAARGAATAATCASTGVYFAARGRYGRDVPVEIPTPEAVNQFFAREFPSASAAGYRCIETGAGLAVARWAYDATQLRPGNLIPGLIQFGLADIAFWFATFTVVGLAPMAVTSELYISYLRPAKGGDL